VEFRVSNLGFRTYGLTPHIKLGRLRKVSAWTVSEAGFTLKGVKRGSPRRFSLKGASPS